MIVGYDQVICGWPLQSHSLKVVACNINELAAGININIYILQVQVSIFTYSVAFGLICLGLLITCLYYHIYIYRYVTMLASRRLK